MRQFGIVFNDSFQERIRSKKYSIITVSMIFIVALLVLLPQLFAGGSHRVEGEIVVLDQMNIVTGPAALEQYVSKSYDWRMIQAEALEQEQIRMLNNDGVLGIVVLKVIGGNPMISVTVNHEEDANFIENLRLFTQKMYTMTEMINLELRPEQKERLTMVVQTEVTELFEDSKSFAATFLPIYLIIFVLYILIYMCGGNVATPLSVENSYKVKGVAVSKVKPIHMLFGKVFGVGSAGVLQFLVIIGTGCALLNVTRSGEYEVFGMEIDISVLRGRTMLLLVAIFILGYLFYAALYAATCSLVNHSEDVNQASMLISLMIVLAFMVSIFAMSNPEGPLAIMGSYIPFFSPFVLFVRIGMAEPTAMSMIVPTIILALSTIVVFWMSYRIYQVSVMLYGQKPTARTVYRAMRSL